MTSLKHWPKESRPSERIQHQPPSTLSIPELLSILIHTGNAQDNAFDLAMRLMDHFHHQVDKLFKASVDELMKVRGIGLAKATTIAAALELNRRIQGTPPPERYFIRNSRDSANFVRSQLGAFKQAEYGALYLVQGGWVKDAGLFKIKDPQSPRLDLQQLLRTALEVMAVSIITFDFCPSDSLQPTPAIQTRVSTIRQAAAKMDIKLLDHVLLNNERHFSFADEGFID